MLLLPMSMSLLRPVRQWKGFRAAFIEWAVTQMLRLVIQATRLDAARVPSPLAPKRLDAHGLVKPDGLEPKL